MLKESVIEACSQAAVLLVPLFLGFMLSERECPHAHHFFGQVNVSDCRCATKKTGFSAFDFDFVASDKIAEFARHAALKTGIIFSLHDADYNWRDISRSTSFAIIFHYHTACHASKRCVT